MENTEYNCLSFFASHLGGIIVKKNNTSFSRTIGYASINDLGYSATALEWSMEAKPLSSITDEDAEVIARMDNPLDEKGFFVFSSKEGAIRFGRNNVYLSINGTKVYQYLQSKGYALPYMGLSLEKLVQYGWVKLKQD